MYITHCAHIHKYRYLDDHVMFTFIILFVLINKLTNILFMLDLRP